MQLLLTFYMAPNFKFISATKAVIYRAVKVLQLVRFSLTCPKLVIKATSHDARALAGRC